MTVFILGHKFHFEIENLCRIFYPNDEIKLEYEYSALSDDYVITSMQSVDEKTVFKAMVNIGDNKAQFTDYIDEYSDEEAEYKLALCLFKALSDVTRYKPAWGMLTGVRPSKLMNKLISEIGVEAAEDYFENRLLVSKAKTQLAGQVAAIQAPIVSSNSPESFSLYISIPFCPSRCSYCSFVSHSITSSNAKKLYEPYLENLAQELEITAKYAAENNLRLETVYFGGGTPGILSAEESEKLINIIKNEFDMSHCSEITFESGRADVITREKLETLKKCGVDRISINPQTFDDNVLDTIGRKHTAAQAVDAYNLAREIGFDSINMDLIAGLPGDSIDGFKKSVDTAIALKAENITVHSLALKRSSNLVTRDNAEISQGNTASEMIDYSISALSAAGYVPYYMYRQSRCVGNLENVGWCLPGKECKYNIYMMEEIHTVLAVGAGAVTKLKAYGQNYLERIFNYKYPYEYNSGFDTLMERKNRITEFYSTYN